MKIKRIPEDFIVEEILEESFKISGEKNRYAVYKLEKKNITTLNLIKHISKTFKIPRGYLSYGGIKDKYALTIQYITIREPDKWKIPEEYEERNFNLKLVGFSDSPITSSSIKGNKFSIVIRDIHPDEVNEIYERIFKVQKFGIFNYYDEQRMGSLPKKPTKRLNSFVKRLMKKDYAEAIRKFLTEPMFGDKGKVIKKKKLIKKYWGDWDKCLSLPLSKQEKKIIKFLKKHPGKYKEAIELIDKDFMNLYISAYQSFIWNKILSVFIAKQKGIIVYKFPYYVNDSLLIPFHIPSELIETLHNTEIPIPTPDVEINDPILKKAYDIVLKFYDLDIKDFSFEEFQNISVKGGRRKALVLLEDFHFSMDQKDEIYENRRKLQLSFSLPSGSYATMVIKHITPLHPKSDVKKKPFPKLFVTPFILKLSEKHKI